ncbi:MAG: hypothetical protein LBP56_01055 [Odoribacteraceae bacterium]|nr:hypothetical protein [Odoribacteraceae bacterium]
MKKRHGILLLLWIAYVCMLSLSAVPHHHHGHVSCFNSSHCIQQEDRAGRDHDHPAPASESDCLANLLVEVTPARQQFEKDPCIPALSPLYLIPLQEVHPLIERRVQECGIPPYREQLHPCLLARVHAGRAPPIG